MKNLRLLYLWNVRLTALLILILGCARVHAQEEGGEQTSTETKRRDYQYADGAGEALSQALELIAKKDYDAAMKVVNDAIKKIPDKTSYSVARLLQVRVQIHSSKGDFANALPDLRRAFQLSDSKNPTYFDEKQTTNMLYVLGVICLQQATGLKDNPEAAKQYSDEAETYLSRWYKTSKSPTPDQIANYASLLFYTAAAKNPADKDKLYKAIEIIDLGLKSAIKPSINLYTLKLACLQQLDRNSEGIALLELLLSENPENVGYWRNLFAFYTQQQNYVAAIATVERAQARGLLNSTSETLNLINLHFNIEQYERAAEILEDKLVQDETIRKDINNWEILAYCYRRMEETTKAIDTLKRAVAVFPKSAQIDYNISQIYYSENKFSEAIPHLQSALSKEGLKKPSQAYLLLAYLAFDQKKYNIALEAAIHAVQSPDTAESAQRMKKAIEERMAAREAKLKKS